MGSNSDKTKNYKANDRGVYRYVLQRNSERARIVKSRAVLMEGEAKALRFYKLLDFDIRVSPGKLKEVKDIGN